MQRRRAEGKERRMDERKKALEGSREIKKRSERIWDLERRKSEIKEGRRLKKNG